MPRIKKITPTDEVEVIAQTKKLVTAESLPEQAPIVKQEADIDGFLTQRAAFITKVNAIMVEGKDYHIIQGKKSLAKGGSEKIASIFHWTAKFDKDTEALEMLGKIKGLVAFKCTLTTQPTSDRHASTIPMFGFYVGEGRGAATLVKNAGDPNKTLKMAQKSAFIDAVLRASGLSDFFTQDLEDMNPTDIGSQPTNYGRNSDPYDAPINSYPPTDKQYEFIKNLMEQKRVDEAWVIEQGFSSLKDLTGGRTGTATELIEMLKNYTPTESVTMQREGMSEPRVIERLSGPGEMVLEDLKNCTSILDYEMIYKYILEGKANNRFTAYDWTAIVSMAKKTITRLQTK